MASSATTRRSTSSSKAMRFVRIVKIRSRTVALGMPTYKRRSMRPGRSRAGSMHSGRFVAATTTTWLSASMPSISVSRLATMRSLEPALWSIPRTPDMASSSSKKTIDGAAVRARRNTSRIARSDSPTYLLTSSGPRTARKLSPLSRASALAVSVLLHPGGPYSKAPRGGSIPSRANEAACLRGHSTHSWTCRLMLASSSSAI